MHRIDIETIISADIQICFDLARSIDLHQLSTAKTNEKAISGITSGLIKMDEIVTWEATHFGIRQKLTSKITAFNPPFHFRDEQLKGAFKYFLHDHYFEQLTEGKILMKDIFQYEAPLGLLGQIFSKFILTNYMRKFLLERNQMIKDYAESEKWKRIIVTQ